MPVRCDFTSVASVDALRDRLESETGGRLDVLVNDVYGGDPFEDWENPYWESSLDSVLGMQRIRGHDVHDVDVRRPRLVRRPAPVSISPEDGWDLSGGLSATAAAATLFFRNNTDVPRD